MPPLAMYLTEDRLLEAKGIYQEQGLAAVAHYLGMTPASAAQLMSEARIYRPNTIKGKKRRAMILKLWSKSGDMHDIAEYVGLQYSAVKRYCKSVGLIGEDGQYAMWPVTRVHVLRIVHRKKVNLEVMPLSLFDSINTGIINAADRFIESSGNDIVQLYAAAQ